MESCKLYESQTNSLWKQVKAHQLQIVNYCLKIHSATWYSLTDCQAFTSYIRSKVKYVAQLKGIVADYLSSLSEQVKRIKRGILITMLGCLYLSDTTNGAREYV